LYQNVMDPVYSCYIATRGEFDKEGLGSSVADPDPGSGGFLTPGSGMSFFRILDPRSNPCF
jgi:hypothetical protein